MKSVFSIAIFALLCFNFAKSIPIPVKRDVRSDLLARAERLLFVVSSEVQLLNGEKRDIEARGLIREETRLIQLELLLKTANSSTEIEQLERDLRNIEDRISEELATLGKDFISNDEKQKIIDNAVKLLKDATGTVKRLEKENKTLVAEAVQREMVTLIQLELDLKAAKKSEDIRRYAEVLIQVEQRIAGLLKDLEGVKRRKRQVDVRQQLINRANDLISRANAEITVLRAANRTADITLLQREEATVQDLVRELRAATNQQQILTIGQRLNDAENRLDAELRRLQIEVINTTQRDAIIRRAEALLQRANTEVLLLRQEGRLILAAQLQFEEAVIAELVRELRAEYRGAVVLQLEQRLIALENNLENELRSITHVISDPEKEALIKRADQVINKTNVEINKLKSDGKNTEAESLANEERLIIELVNQLRKTNDTAEGTRLKNSLKTELDRIEDLIKKYETTSTSDPERDALLKRADDLKKRAETQIAKLKSQKKDLEASALDAEEKLAEELVNQLVKAKDPAEIKGLKDRLKTALDKLEEDVKTYESLIIDDERDALIKRAQDLKPRVDTEINKLKSENRDLEASVLQAEQSLVDELINDIRKIKDTNELTAAKAKLKSSIDKLEADVAKFEAIPAKDPELETLQKRTDDTKAKVSSAISKLNTQNRNLEANVLDSEMKLAEELLNGLKKSPNATESKRLKDALKAKLDQLDDQLKAIDQAATDAEKDALLKRAEELKTRANTAITKLMSEGREIEASLINSDLKLVNQLVVELTKATPAELTNAKSKLKSALDDFEAQLKKVETTAADPEANALYQRNEDLKPRVANVTGKLNNEGKTADANAITTQQALIEELINELKRAINAADIARLKSSLKSALDKQEQNVKNAEVGPVSDPEVDALVKRNDGLKANVSDALNKLKTEGRTAEMSAIENQQKLVDELVNEAKKATAAAEVKRLKDELKAALDKQEAQIKKAYEPPTVDADLRTNVLRSAEQLHNKSMAAIQVLKDQGRGDKAGGIEIVMKEILSLIDEIKKANSNEDLIALSELEASIEEQLHQEIEATVDTRQINVKDVQDLNKKAEELEDKARKGVIELEKQGKTAEAENLRLLGNELIVLDVLASFATTQDELERYKTSLQDIEKKVTDAIRGLGITRRKRQTTDQLKEQLIQRAQQLITQANSTIAILRQQNRTSEANALQREVTTIEDLVKQLRAATAQGVVRVLEQRLSDAENRLNAELRSINLEAINDTERQAIIKRAEDLLANATAAVTRLRQEGKILLATELQFEEAVISELVRELRVATQPTLVRQLEQRLIQSENTLAAQLAQIGNVTTDPEKDALIKRADQVSANITVTAQKLIADGRSREAVPIQLEQRLIQEMVNELKKLTDTTELARVKKELKDLLDSVEEQLKNLGGTSTTDPEKDDLVKRAANVTQRTDTQIYKLKNASKEFEADALDAQKNLVKELVSELGSVVGNDAETKRVKDALKKNLDDLEKKVANYEKQIIDPERDALIKRYEQELQRVINAENKLKSQNRTNDLAALQNQDDLANTLVKQAKNATDADELKKVKDSLKQTLDKLEDALMKIEDEPITPTELKNRLTKEVEDLNRRTDDAIKQLNNTGKDAEVKELQQIQQQIQNLTDQIKNATKTEDLQTIDPQIKKIENDLKAELDKIGVQVPEVSEKEVEALVTRAEDLSLKAKEAIQDLLEKGRDVEAEGLRMEVEGLVVLDVLLRTSTTKQEVYQLSMALAEIERRVERELKGLNRRKRDLKADLVDMANNLLRRADEEIKLLQAQGNQQDATAVKNSEDRIKTILAKLQNTTSDAELRTIEEQLGAAEGQLIITLLRLGVPLSGNDIKKAIIIVGEELVLLSEDQIKKLTDQNKTDSIQLLRADVNRINQLVAQLKNATLTGEILILSNQLLAIELQTREQLRRLGIGVDVNSTKTILLAEAESLINRTNSVIARLRQSGSNQSVAELEREERVIRDLVDQVKNATDEAMLSALEFQLGQAEFRLELELSYLGEAVISRQERQSLINRIEELASRVIVAVRKLDAQNRTVEAAGLRQEEQRLVTLDVEVRNETKQDQLINLERNFAFIEARVNAELQALGV